MNTLRQSFYNILSTSNSAYSFLKVAPIHKHWYCSLDDKLQFWFAPFLEEILSTKFRNFSHWEAYCEEGEAEKFLLRVEAMKNRKQHILDHLVRFKTISGDPVEILFRGLLVECSGQQHILGFFSQVHAHSKTVSNTPSNDYLKLLLEGAEIATWSLDLTSFAIQLGASTAKMLGYRVEDFENNPTLTSQLAHPKDQEYLKTVCTDHLLGKTDRYEARYRIRHKQGHYIWVRDKGKISLYDDNGNPLILTGIKENINDEIQRTSELENIRNLLEKSNQAANIGTWELDVKTGLPSWSSMTKKIHEVDEDYIPSLETALNFYEDISIHEKVRTAVSLAIEAGRDFDHEVQLRTAKGNLKWVRITATTEFKEGKCTRLYGTIQDINDVKLSALKLQASLETNRLFVEEAPNAIAMFDKNMHYITTSKKWISDYKLEGKRLIGKSHYEIFPEIGEDWKQDHRECLQGGVIKSNDELFIRHNGQKQWINWDIRPWYEAPGTIGGLLIMTSDITDKKLAELKLKDSEEQLQAIIDSSTHVAIIGTDIKGQINFFNRGAKNLLGYSAEEASGMSFSDFIQNEIEIQERSAFLSKLYGRLITGNEIFTEQANQGTFDSHEWTFQDKTGHSFPVRLIITPIRNSNGKVYGYLGLANDISETKEAEKRISSLLKISEEQNSKLRNFTQIVSHNLRSHSSNFTMLLNLMEEEEENEIKETLLPLLRTSSKDLEETIFHLNEVLSLSSQEYIHFEEIYIKEHVDRTIDSIKPLLQGVNFRITNNVDSEIKGKVVPTYFDSIMYNLLSNAIKFRSSERILQIDISAIKSANKLVIEVKDNGIGIDLTRHNQKIFGMYQTFHEHVNARGIGLFLSKNKAEAMGGSIEVSSTPNKGSLFKVHMHEV